MRAHTIAEYGTVVLCPRSEMRSANSATTPIATALQDLHLSIYKQKQSWTWLCKETVDKKHKMWILIKIKPIPSPSTDSEMFLQVFFYFCVLRKLNLVL